MPSKAAQAKKSKARPLCPISDCGLMRARRRATPPVRQQNRTTPRAPPAPSASRETPGHLPRRDRAPQTRNWLDCDPTWWRRKRAPATGTVAFPRSCSHAQLARLRRQSDRTCAGNHPQGVTSTRPLSVPNLRPRAPAHPAGNCCSQMRQKSRTAPHAHPASYSVVLIGAALPAGQIPRSKYVRWPLPHLENPILLAHARCHDVVFAGGLWPLGKPAGSSTASWAAERMKAAERGANRVHFAPLLPRHGRAPSASRVASPVPSAARAMPTSAFRGTLVVASSRHPHNVVHWQPSQDPSACPISSLSPPTEQQRGPHAPPRLCGPAGLKRWGPQATGWRVPAPCLLLALIQMRLHVLDPRTAMSHRGRARGRAAEDIENAQTSTRSATAGKGAAGGATRALASRQVGRPGGPFPPLPSSATKRRKRIFFTDLLVVVRQQIRPLSSANNLPWHRLALTSLSARSRRSLLTCGTPKAPPRRYP